MSTTTPHRLRYLPIGLVVSAALAFGPLAAAPLNAAAEGAEPATVAESATTITTGWDTYRQLDRLPELHPGNQTRQFSSYDRTGDNDDGFDGTYSCLREVAAGCVIAADDGPGSIESIWFTRDDGDVTRTGNIMIELDGETVVDAPLQDLVSGKLGEPFVFPLVARGDQSSGGVTIKVPMAYRESMVVTTTENPLFHHVSHRDFPSAEGIETFDPDDAASDVVENLSAYGTHDPKPADPDVQQISKDFTLDPGQSIDLGRLRRGGTIGEFALQIPQIEGIPDDLSITDDGRAFKGSSRFTMAIDPDNDGVQLKRRYDSLIGHQKADVYVDDELVGRWDSGEPSGGQWADETIEIPAEVTAGKTTIAVRNVFVSSDVDVNEFRYWTSSIVDGDAVESDMIDIGPGDEALASEQAHDYVITDPLWEGVRTYIYPPSAELEERLAKSDALLRGLRLQLTFDGRRTANAPLGEFFGSGLGEAKVRTLMYAMDTAPDGAYTSWWPMPFGQSARVRLVNKSEQSVTAGTSSISWKPDSAVAKQLRGASPTLGYFNATSKEAHTVKDDDWRFLDVKGNGRFVGVNHTMTGLIEEGNIRNYLEGDERVYVDGSRTPTLYGTGSEDFYEAGWYFNHGAFTNPMNGAPLAKSASFGCEYQCDSAYRLMIGDAVEFTSSLRFGIEHGPTSKEPAIYSSTAFWYGHQHDATSTVTDQIDVGDTESEKAHGFEGGTDATTLTSVFEGDDDTVEFSDDLRSGAVATSFTLGVEPGQGDVLLRRTGDQEQPQSAVVSVNGTEVGRWSQPQANKTQRWLQDTFTVPAAVITDSNELKITITPEEGSAPWSAGRYEAVQYGS